MRLGLSSYTYGWAVGTPGRRPAQPLDELGLLDRCQEHGLKLLQVGDNLPLHALGPARQNRFLDRARDEGVELEVGARRLTVDQVATQVVLARQAGARLIRFVIDDAGYEPTPSDVVVVLRKTLPLLEGLVLGLENHDRFPARVLRGILESVGSERLGICLDTANSLGAGEGLDTVVRELGPFAVNLHLKDFQVRRVPHLMGFTVEGRPAGSGSLDIPALLSALRPFGRCATAVLELWTPPGPDPEATRVQEAAWARQSLEFLKPLFARFP